MMESMQKIIKTEYHHGQVVRLTLNAPKGNVLDSHMMNALQEAFDQIATKSNVKLIQLAGAGNHFSFGASVAEHTKEKAPAMLAQFHQLLHTIMDLKIPTAAIVSGQCLGGGLELALMGHFLFADETAILGQPEINLGVFAPPASIILPLKIGQSKADELLLTGKTLPATDMEKYGLVTRLFENRNEMENGVDVWLRKYILPKSASSLQYALQAARWTFNASLRKQLKLLEEYYTTELMESHDANEGILAFLEKRPPKWEAETSHK